MTIVRSPIEIIGGSDDFGASDSCRNHVCNRAGRVGGGSRGTLSSAYRGDDVCDASIVFRREIASGDAVSWQRCGKIAAAQIEVIVRDLDAKHGKVGGIADRDLIAEARKLRRRLKAGFHSA